MSDVTREQLQDEMKRGPENRRRDFGWSFAIDSSNAKSMINDLFSAHDFDRIFKCGCPFCKRYVKEFNFRR